MDKQTIVVGSPGTLLQIAFIVLKLCNVITWSWFWVLSPLWIGACIAVISLAFYLVVSIFYR